MTMGDRVAVLKLGVLQQAAAPQELYDHPDNLFVAGFIGSPSMNIAEARVVTDDGAVFVELGRGERPTRLRVGDAALERYSRVADRAGDTVAMGIRPEHVVPADEVAEDQRWPGRKVTLVEMLGAEMLVHFGTSASPIVSEDMKAAIDDEEAFEEMQRRAEEGGQEFVARFDPTSPPKAGDLIDVGVRTGEMHFFDVGTGEALR